MPPTQAPILSGQTSNSTCTPGMPLFMRSKRMYTKVVVNGRDSRKALPIDESQRTTKMAKYILLSS